MTAIRHPAVVIHGLADARAVLAFRQPVTLLSGSGAALYAGSLWWRSVVAQATSEYPDVPVQDILDCADASGVALGALRIGQRRIVLYPSAPGRAAVAATAGSLGAELLPARPTALDCADRAAVRHLPDWLHQGRPGDSDDRLS